MITDKAQNSLICDVKMCQELRWKVPIITYKLGHEALSQGGSYIQNLRFRLLENTNNYENRKIYRKLCRHTV